jgi:hypothetical protein
MGLLLMATGGLVAVGGRFATGVAGMVSTMIFLLLSPSACG